MKKSGRGMCMKQITSLQRAFYQKNYEFSQKREFFKECDILETLNNNLQKQTQQAPENSVLAPSVLVLYGQALMLKCGHLQL